ncbi:MAG: hypothetical protein ACRCTY_05450 [Candidatus Adiutrix sp.]
MTQVRGDKFWRTGALILLCALVYFFSYDHGRQSVEPKLRKLQREATNELENQKNELLRLREALNGCQLTAIEPQTATEAHERFNLETGHSEIIFDGRLVIALLNVEPYENKATVQLNFIEHGHHVSEVLGAGGSITFQLDEGNWALVLRSIQENSITLSVVQIRG